jgi:pimeloyl-ACP methyl ester carboxylesterase
MSQFLLIHGAWHDARCWNAVVAGLAQAGHEARAIDLPGMGEDRTALSAIGLQTWTDRVLQELGTFATPPILVGHSMGGMVITAAADAAPDKVRLCVYVCAFLPRDGESLLSLATRPEGASTALTQESTPDGLCVTVPAASARVAFYGRCTDAVADAAIGKLSLQPLRPVLEPVRLHAVVPVPRVYIECTEDRAMPIALQRFMAGRSPGIRLHSLPSDHSPFLSMAPALTALLAGLS